MNKQGREANISHFGFIADFRASDLERAADITPGITSVETFNVEESLPEVGDWVIKSIVRHAHENRVSTPQESDSLLLLEQLEHKIRTKIAAGFIPLRVTAENVDSLGRFWAVLGELNSVSVTEKTK